jgi:hypothetical protein
MTGKAGKLDGANNSDGWKAAMKADGAIGTDGATGAETDVSADENEFRARRKRETNFQPNGKFAPGNQAAVKPPRPARIVNRDYVDAMRAGLPPDRVMQLLDKAIELAIATKSSRGIMQAVEFAANYTLGKPRQRAESAGNSGLAEILRGIDTSKPLLDDDDEDTAENE